MESPISIPPTVAVMGMDNDLRGWIMCIVSSIGRRVLYYNPVIYGALALAD